MGLGVDPREPSPPNNEAGFVILILPLLQFAPTLPHRHLPAADAPQLLKRRFQIINLWRPLVHPAWDWPLALCDWRSVDPHNDVVPVTLRYPDREGETFGVKYSPEHHWKYLKGMQPDEFVLIKWFVVHVRLKFGGC